MGAPGVAACGEMAVLRDLCPPAASRWLKVSYWVMQGWANPGCVGVARVVLACVFVGSAASLAHCRINAWASLWIIPGLYALISHSSLTSLVHIIW